MSSSAAALSVCESKKSWYVSEGKIGTRFLIGTKGPEQGIYYKTTSREDFITREGELLTGITPPTTPVKMSGLLLAAS